MIPMAEVIAAGTLSEECEGYLLGRGFKEETIRDLGCITWTPPEEPVSKDDEWLRFGPMGKGEYLRGRLILPLWSPRGGLLGFEARKITQKKISRYLLPEAAWNPVWAGLSPSGMQKIWDGGNVWVCEGFFDVAPLQWCIPEKDVSLGSVRAKLTAKHIQFLRRFCRGSVFIVYDNDEAGRKGVVGWVDESGKKHWGALQSLEHAGLRCYDVRYSGGGDPGEIYSRRGVTALRAEFSQWRNVL